MHQKPSKISKWIQLLMRNLSKNGESLQLGQMFIKCRCLWQTWGRRSCKLMQELKWKLTEPVRTQTAKLRRTLKTCFRSQRERIAWTDGYQWINNAPNRMTFKVHRCCKNKRECCVNDGADSALQQVSKLICNCLFYLSNPVLTGNVRQLSNAPI